MSDDGTPGAGASPAPTNDGTPGAGASPAPTNDGTPGAGASPAPTNDETPGAGASPAPTNDGTPHVGAGFTPARPAPRESTRPPIPAELQRRFLTGDVDPVPGVTRAEPEDFVVEEVPLYEPCGEGEHLYLLVEKRGITTEEAARRLAKRLKAKRKNVGYAGRKDARAVTRQRISVFGAKPFEEGALDDEQLRVLDATPHRNKLKVGHLLGNRFTLRVRGGAPGLDSARTVLERLEAGGIANYFGLQRFGRLRNTHRLGQALVAGDADAFLELLWLGARESQGEPAHPTRPGSRLADARAAVRSGDFQTAARAFPPSMHPEQTSARARADGRDPEACVRAIPAKQRSFYVAAYQSLLFNAYLSRRIDAGLLTQVEVGEVVSLHKNGAAFVVSDAAVDQPRCEAFELSPSGPLFGRKLLRPADGSGPHADEEAVLTELAPGLSAELSEALGAKPHGSRRPLRIPVRDVHVTADGDDLVLGFFLPKGCYATSVLEELLGKPID